MSSINKNNGDTSTLLNRICKLQERQEKLLQDQNKSREEEYSIMREHLSQLNKLLDELIKVTATGSTVVATKKIIPFHTGSQSVGQLVTPPSNPDDYPTQINLYAQNDNRPIQHMTLINDGPGELFFVVGYSQTDINTKEGKLNVNDQRELFNVYQIRLRSTLPTSTFRLIEGIFRTGSFAPQTKANVKIQPEVQTNEILVELDALFDNTVSTITITSPTVHTLTPNYILPALQPPLPPGTTATLVDTSTGLIMPYTIPDGFIAELFAILGNLSTDNTVRFYIELIPGEFTLFTTLPSSNRGVTLNLVLNVSMFSTQVVDPAGAPAGGRRILATITNDDPFNNMIGDYDLLFILRRLT